MDGVSSAASVFGVASLAIQLVESIDRLVTFWKAVQNAPANINSLFGELELLRSVLEQTRKINALPISDRNTEKALGSCQSQILKLETIIGQAIKHFNSDKFYQRKWSAFKITLKGEEIAAVLNSIEHAKSTLLLLQQNVLIDLTTSNTVIQQNLLGEVSCIRSSIQNLSLTTGEMRGPKFDPGTLEEYRFRPEPAAISECPGAATIQVTTEHNLAGVSDLQSIQKIYETSPFNRPYRRFISQSWDPQTSREFSFVTPLLGIHARSRTYLVKTVRALGTDENVERDVAYIIYPKLLRQIGISVGIQISARSITGWKYSIQPFRSVPEEAMIFEFCREGNVAAVRTLFNRGEASPWDRDHLGRTPLWFAASSLQLDVAEYLLQSGADPHARDWRHDCEPIRSIIFNGSINVNPKLAMINVLQNNKREEYDNDDIQHMMLRFMQAYRPQKVIDMTWAQRRNAALRILATLIASFDPHDPEIIAIIHVAILFYYEQNVLHWLLDYMKGPFTLLGTDSSVIHLSMERRLLERDPPAMKAIVQRTDNIHLRIADSSSWGLRSTPTMLAMYDMGLFLAWSRLLRQVGHDIRPFVSRELEEGLLKEQGWDESSLTFLFEENFVPDPHHAPTALMFPSCERCGDEGSGIFVRLKVDLKWRRRLRDIRRLHSSRSSLAGLPSFNVGLVPAGDQTLNGSDASGSSQDVETQATSTDSPEVDPEISKPLPYRIVCSRECRDDVCVAWVYENDSTDEPDFPPYPLQPEVGSGKASLANQEVGQEQCPTKKIPGAFID